jgi:hypothetical protein
MHNNTNPNQTLQDYLDDLALAIIDRGTSTESRRLAVMAQAVRDIAPGVADALTDQSGSEVARLRAFGKAASQLVRLAGVIDHGDLISELDGRRVETMAA